MLITTTTLTTTTTGNVPREAGEIPYTEVGNSVRMDKEKGNEEKISSIHDKSNVFNQKQQGGEIHIGALVRLTPKPTSVDTTTVEVRN